jgi:predicted DNA-binding helix-hairpin-helix protein
MAQMQERIVEAKKTPPLLPGRQSTQMIVGADDATDADVLRTSATLYGDYDLKRVYYSAFQPDSGFERRPAAEIAADAAREPALSGRLAAAVLRFDEEIAAGARPACSTSTSTRSWPGP